MSEGRFSQPRPYREEDRQIEESFRQLTDETSRRRKKTYNVEEDIQNTIRELTEQEVSRPRETGLPLERSARLEQTVQVAPEQLPPQRPVSPPVPPVTPPPQPRMPQQTQTPRYTPKYDLLSEDLDTFFESRPEMPEESFPEEEPDLIDRLMNFGEFFRKHQTPVILGLCGAAVLLIALFVSIFLTGGSRGSNDSNTVMERNILIAGVNINGMTREQAVDAIEAVTDTTYLQNDMVVDFGTTQLLLSPKDTGAKLDVRSAVDAAFEADSSRDQQYIALLPYLHLNTDHIRNTLTAYAEDTGSTLTQTSYGLEGDDPQLAVDKFNENAPTQTLIIVMGTPGIGFDVNDVYNKVLDAYSLHQFLVEVENVESVSDPDPIDLEAIYREFYIEPVNASVNLQNFKTEAGSYGYGFDLEAAQKLVAKAQPGEVLRIPMAYIAPEILDSDAFFRDTLGEHRTRSSSNDYRNRNLQLACEAVNGTVLNPGETLSFSNLLNQVNGFWEAPEDTGLEEIEKGGVTQVASTLYYAALMSDLNITSRSSHAYLPSFIDYGLDARENLKLVNSTGYPIRIDAEYAGGYVKVTIWGTEERNSYVMLESSISSSTAPGTVYEDFPYDNAEGYEDGDVIREGSNGYLVKSYRVRYDRKTGKEQSREFITNSQYPVVDRIVARVEAPPETQPPTQAPTEAPTQPPTETPTEAPTEAPTTAPTQAPTTQPTEAPTEAPAEAPTEAPAEAVTGTASDAPETASEAPSEASVEENG